MQYLGLYCRAVALLLFGVPPSTGPGLVVPTSFHPLEPAGASGTGTVRRVEARRGGWSWVGGGEWGPRQCDRIALPEHALNKLYVHAQYMHTYMPTYIHTYLPTYLHTYLSTDRPTHSVERHRHAIRGVSRTALQRRVAAGCVPARLASHGWRGHTEWCVPGREGLGPYLKNNT